MKDWLDCEHDPSLRSVAALADGLALVYGQEIPMASVITAIAYEITDWGILKRVIPELHPD